MIYLKVKFNLINFNIFNRLILHLIYKLKHRIPCLMTLGKGKPHLELVVKICSNWETLNPIWVFNAVPPLACHHHATELPKTLFISVLGSTIFFLFSYFLHFKMFFL